MLKVPETIQPLQATLDVLAAYQKDINDLSTFEEKSKKAKDSFSNRNQKGNIVFDAIKVKLLEICPGIERCVYCEDSKCDEVEHIYPKDLYPQHCFEWSNYVYACGPCNGPKNNQFAIFRADNGLYHEVNPPKRQKATEPPTGDSVLINPRVDNPFDFCRLDLKTFKFAIIAQPNTKEYTRANYTYNTVLRLNEQRDYLRKQREMAYSNYKARLESYTNKKNDAAPQVQLDKMIANLKRESHPTVWKEMQRHYNIGLLEEIDAELNGFFKQSPEALTW